MYFPSSALEMPTIQVCLCLRAHSSADGVSGLSLFGGKEGMPLKNKTPWHPRTCISLAISPSRGLLKKGTLCIQLLHRGQRARGLLIFHGWDQSSPHLYVICLPRTDPMRFHQTRSVFCLQIPSHPPGFTGPLGPFCCSLQPFSTFDGYLGTLGLECHSPGLSLSAECVAGTDLFHAYLNELFHYPCGVGCRTTPSLPQRKLRKEEAEA